MKVPDVAGIYRISCSVSEFVYIGQARNFRTRFNLHRTGLRNNKHHCTHLQRSWNKHGESAFSFEIVELVFNMDKLTEREQYWMDLHRGKLFNSSPAAASPSGYRHTPEAREKISSSKIGIARSDETKAAIAKANKGFRHTDATRQKLSEIAKRVGATEEYKAKISLKSKAAWDSEAGKKRRMRIDPEAVERWKKTL